MHVDGLPRHLAPCRHSLGQRRDRSQRIASLTLDPAAPVEIVDDGDIVALTGESHCGGPAEIPVATEDEYTHVQVLQRSIGCGRYYGEVRPTARSRRRITV